MILVYFHYDSFIYFLSHLANISYLHLSLPMQPPWAAMRYCRAPEAPRQCRAAGYLIIWHGGGVLWMYLYLFIVHRSFPMPSPGIENRHCRAPKGARQWHTLKGSTQFSLSLFVFLFVCPGDISAILWARKLKFWHNGEQVLCQKRYFLFFN